MIELSLSGFIGGRSVDVLDIQKKDELDTYSKIDFSIAAGTIDLFDIRNSSFQIYINNVLFASGIILNRPSLSFENGKHTIKISGISDLGSLTCDRAYSLAYYQDSLISSILTDLLSTATTTITLDSSGFADALTATTTIDVRSKETLFAQIVEVIKSYPNLHFRESISGGIPVLEIGEFDSILYSGNSDNILSMSLEQNQNRVYNKVEGYSGNSPDLRLSLNDAITDGRALLSAWYAQYPIVVDINGLAYVENTAVPNGCSTVKDFDLIKTDNNSSVTQQNKNDASYALYQKCVRFLQNTDDSENFDISIITPYNLLTLGDRIRVVKKVTETFYNPLTMRMENIAIADVNSDYKITNINTKLETFDFFEGNGVSIGKLYKYDIRITNSEDAANYDSEMELFDRLNKPNDLPSLTSNAIDFEEITVVHDETIDASDVVLGGGELGKTFTFDVMTPAPPSAVGKNFFVSIISPSDVIWEIGTYVAGDLTDIVLNVSGAAPNYDWGTGTDVISVTIAVQYT